MFIDVATIEISSGKGGAGSISFRREKFAPKGGPDGGDGGDGGSVIIVGDSNLKSLMDFNYRKKFNAANGAPGEGRKKSGKKSDDLIIRVPEGTLVKDLETDELIVDITEKNQEFVIAKGGFGGKGNARFATSVNQTPYMAQKGTPGESKEIKLELKLIADIGLVGMPNAGKSSLLSRITASKPKIANYPFTTLKPNLGVMKYQGKQLVIADIPGLIEKAYEGKGLGHQFLRHVERTRIIIHMLDVSDFAERDVINDFDVITKELKQFNSEILEKEQIVVFNKVDIVQDKSKIKKLESHFSDYKHCTISAVTGEGIDKLTQLLFNL